MFASLKGVVDVSAYLAMLPSVQWKVVKGRDYQTAFIDPPEGARAAFFLKLPPGGKLHPHVDAGDCVTEHIVVQTNPKCLNWWRDKDGDHSQRMEAGKRYVVDRSLLHWAENGGKTDRVHLLVEF